MSEFQIDPYKLNDVLQQILDKVTEVQDKTNNASPEFQVLMGNYLTKANEAERNQARFEEALERLDLSEQETKKLKNEVEELRQRIRSHEKDFDALKNDQEKETSVLRQELNHAIQANSELESNVAAKYIKEINSYKSEAERQITQLQTDLDEELQTKRKLEERIQLRTQEADAHERELSELKIKLADEQSKIREEIIEATKRSVQIEQTFQRDKEQMLKKIKELETSTEEINSNLVLKQRELEYKDALLSQAIRQPNRAINDFVQSFGSVPNPSADAQNAPQNLSVNKTSNLVPSFDNIPNPIETTTFSQSPQTVNLQSESPAEQFTTVPAREEIEAVTTAPTSKPNKEKKIGGIWARLSSSH
jgi:chromosome segregation ATPase